MSTTVASMTFGYIASPTYLLYEESLRVMMKYNVDQALQDDLAECQDELIHCLAIPFVVVDSEDGTYQLDTTVEQVIRDNLETLSDASSNEFLIGDFKSIHYIWEGGVSRCIHAYAMTINRDDGEGNKAWTASHDGSDESAFSEQVVVQLSW